MCEVCHTDYMKRYQKIIGAIAIVVAVGVFGAIYLQETKQVPNIPVVVPEVTIDEAASVEDYVRSNIAKLSPEPAVLGGTWYVVDLSIDTDGDTGVVTYEDGHIQSVADFTYRVDANGAVSSVTLIKK